MRLRGAVALALVAAAPSPAAAAQADACANVVIVALPGVTWADLRRDEPPHLLALAERGSIGSVSVRTNTSRTTYASGFATVGAGTRVDAPKSAGAAARPAPQRAELETDVRVAGIEAIAELAREAGYSTARPGALAAALDDRQVVAIGSSSLGFDPPSPVGADRPVLLAAMDDDGVVDAAAVGPGLLRPDSGAPFGVRTDVDAVAAVAAQALEDPCAVVVLDPGDLVRADTLAVLQPGDVPAQRTAALLSADAQLGAVAELLDDDDLLLAVTVTSPRSEEETHLGVAAAAGPGFAAGARLESATTRKDGIVTLPDVAPTVLEHLGVDRPSSMLGRPWFAEPASGDLVAQAVDLDEESVFSYGVQPGVATGFVVAQVAAYVGLLALFGLRRRGAAVPEGVPATALEVAALAVAAFPLASYLAGAGMTHELGVTGFVALLLGVDAVLVGLAFAALRSPLDRLLGVAAATLVVMVGDLALGERLQLNAVFGNSPIVAGRFAGLGNLAFSILGASALVTATVLVHRAGRGRGALAAAAAIFAGAVVVDGAPGLGSDVGGVLALVPGLAVTWILLSGRKVNARTALVAGLAGVLALGAFLAVDLTRPEESRTHLARLVENVADEGPAVFADTIERKVRTNLRIFGSTIWTYLVPPALLLLAVLLRKPPGRWQQLASRFPVIRSGLVGGLVLALLGFAVNDSGIVVPAMFLSWLVPLALVTYVSLEKHA
ncbi:MAG TPA: hypothetical protein VG318_03765 [Actinomycetota bacterium]|nr:hypothetical protein [Actinomycetota bacterium]